MFWKNKSQEYLNSTEYESLAKKITELSSELEILKNKYKVMETNYDNLRGNFNRKLSGIKKGQEEDEEENTNPMFPKTKDIKPFSPF